METPSRMYESDPYLPFMADDLLKGLNDWRNIQDIVRLTFKALSDVVRTQGQAIRDIERQLPLKVHRSEFTLALSQKANANELSEFHEALENRIPYMDFKILSEEKVSRSDVQYLLSNKPSIEEVRNLLEGKANIREVESEIGLVKAMVEDIQRDISRKLAQLPNERELEYLHSQLKDKVSIDEFREALEQKASKQTVNTALSSKVDKYSFDEFMMQKNDLDEIQRIMAALEAKADYSLFEQLHADLQEKVDRSDIAHVILPEIAKKAEKFEIEMLLKEFQVNVDNHLLENSATIDAYINSFKADLEQTRRTFNAGLSKKIEAKDIDKLYSALTKKADFEVMVELLEKIKFECRDIANDIKKDLKKSEDFDFKYRLENEIAKIKESLEIFAEKLKDESDERVLYVRNMAGGIKAEIQKDLGRFFDEQKITQDSIKDIVISRADNSEVQALKNLVVESQKAIDKMRENFMGNNAEIVAAMKAMKDEASTKHRNLENQVYETLSQKVNTNDLPKLMEGKLDSGQALKVLGIKSTQDEIAIIKKEIEKMHIDISRKCNASDLDTHIQSTEFALQDVAKDMLLKCNIKDVCALLDMKANVDDTNKALSDIHKELDNKVGSPDFSNHLSDYHTIIEALCAENCLGRWLWKSGELKNGSLVPWEIQSVNTAPDNFLWEKEKISIVTVAPGLYEIVLGFYSRKKPTIQILVNGEPIMSAVNSSSYVVHHSSGKLKPVTSHPNGNIAGITLIDFIALPARARVSIGFTGEIHSEGFIGLRKL